MLNRNGMLCAAGLIAAVGAGAQGGIDNILNIDLSVTDTITITADTGLAASGSSGSNFTGFLLEDFFAAASGSSLFGTLVSGDLTTANNPADSTPALFSGSTSVGLNVWSFSSDTTVTTTAGSLAMTGSATWTVSAAEYADMLAGATSGNVYLPADSDDDISTSNLIGTYTVVPTPGTLVIACAGGVMGVRRRRK